MNEIWNTRNHSEINRMIARIPAVSGRFYWSEWNYRIPRNYEQQKWYSGRWQSVFHDISITRFRRQFEKVP